MGQTLLASMLIAVSAAGCCGASCAMLGLRAMRAQRSASRLRQAAGGARDAATEAPAESSGMAAWVLTQIRREGQRTRSVRMRSLLRKAPLGYGLADAADLLARAGLPEADGQMVLRGVRAQLIGKWAALGGVAGLCLSPELSCVLALAGAMAGYLGVPWALRCEARSRTASMERHLSEMVEVMILGLRSGLSFERSFALYPRYFDTELGRFMRQTARQWEMGLMTREAALHRFETGYESALLSRVVGSMVRSLRFGTSIADALEASAAEAREVHRSRMEERVAKVAVKMMLPVGGLILPAMLLLVLGPVLLELVEGF